MAPIRAVAAKRLDQPRVTRVGQHDVYCHRPGLPEQPALDIQAVMRDLTHAKQLIQTVKEGLRAEREGWESAKQVPDCYR